MNLKRACGQDTLSENKSLSSYIFFFIAGIRLKRNKKKMALRVYVSNQFN